MYRIARGLSWPTRLTWPQWQATLTSSQAPRYVEHGLNKMKTDETLSRVGRQIQGLRVSKGISQEQLAHAADVSSGLISQLERGIGNPSFVTLAKISYALGVPISTFFEDGRSPDIVVRRDKRKKLIVPEFAEDGPVYELLTPDLNRALEAIWVEFPAGASNEERPFQHQGEECGILLAGVLEVHIADEVHCLEAGDSIAYASNVVHWYRNPGPVTAKSIWIITPPSF